MNDKEVSAQLPQWQTESDKKTKKRRLHHALFFLVIVVLWHIPWFHRKPAPPERGTLKLGKCSNIDDPFLCGTLTAPLDYTNLSDPRNASIAVAVYPAGAGKTPKDEILGSILFNPGGPGGSGIYFLTSSGRASLLDEMFEGKYNLVSFDPRGVGETWPAIECFNNEFDMLYYIISGAANGYPGHHGSHTMKHEVGTIIAQYQLLSDVCESHESAELQKFMGTAFVARDMQLLHRAMGDEKLNYWGFSYGTVLGSTYADMFPDDVNRLIIDGVVDVDNYYQGKWSDALKDVESELDAYFDECMASGPEACKLSKLVDPGSEGAALKELVMDFANKLKHRPVALARANPPQLLTYSELMAGFLESMYRPVLWPFIAEAVYSAIAEDDFSHISGSLNLGLGAEVAIQIACSDNVNDAPEYSWNISDYEKHVVAIREDSPHFSEYLAGMGLICGGIWPIRAVERYRGNFTSTTSFPVLVLGNEYDPVTPGRYADKMANRFGNAVSVRREGYGHCSISQPSKCIDEIVIKYFLKGEVPPLNTRCSVDYPVFGRVVVESSPLTLSDILHDGIYDANNLFLQRRK